MNYRWMSLLAGMILAMAGELLLCLAKEAVRIHAFFLVITIGKRARVDLYAGLCRAQDDDVEIMSFSSM